MMFSTIDEILSIIDHQDSNMQPSCELIKTTKVSVPPKGVEKISARSKAIRKIAAAGSNCDAKMCCKNRNSSGPCTYKKLFKISKVERKQVMTIKSSDKKNDFECSQSTEDSSSISRSVSTDFEDSSNEQSNCSVSSNSARAQI